MPDQNLQQKLELIADLDGEDLILIEDELDRHGVLAQSRTDTPVGVQAAALVRILIERLPKLADPELARRVGALETDPGMPRGLRSLVLWIRNDLEEEVEEGDFEGERPGIFMAPSDLQLLALAVVERDKLIRHYREQLARKAVAA